MESFWIPSSKQLLSFGINMFHRKEIIVVVETNFMIVNKCLGPNVIMREQILSCENKCYHVGTNVIM
jgi:hypothetical protein